MPPSAAAEKDEGKDDDEKRSILPYLPGLPRLGMWTAAQTHSHQHRVILVVALTLGVPSYRTFWGERAPLKEPLFCSRHDTMHT